MWFSLSLISIIYVLISFFCIVPLSASQICSTYIVSAPCKPSLLSICQLGLAIFNIAPKLSLEQIQWAIISFITFFSKFLLVRIVGLKQDGGGGVNCFLTFFANFEGMEKANEESKPKEWKCSSYKTVLVDFQKINRLFIRFDRLFLSTVYKRKVAIFLLYCDNDVARKIEVNLVFHEQTKNIETNCHIVREKLTELGLINICSLVCGVPKSNNIRTKTMIILLKERKLQYPSP